MTKKLLKKSEALKLTRENDFKSRIVGYFRVCAENEELPQKAGLLISLGLSRDQWNDLIKEFPTLATRADHFIEKIWVEKLLSPSATGAMFYLKNTFRDIYKDKSEHDVNIRVPKPLLEGVTPLPPP